MELGNNLLPRRYDPLKKKNTKHQSQRQKAKGKENTLTRQARKRGGGFWKILEGSEGLWGGSWSVMGAPWGSWESLGGPLKESKAV